MRIGLVTTCQHPCSAKTGWGAESYMWNMVECFNILGHDVTLFAKKGSNIPEEGRLIVCNYEEDVINNFGRILKENVDIVHDFSAFKQTHNYCQENNIKSIATNFNVHFLKPEIHKNIVCVSNRQRQLGLQGKSGFEGTSWDKMVGYTGHLKSNAKIVYLGLDLNIYKPKYEKQDYFLYLNSYDYRKGITIVIQLAKEMEFPLIIAGEMKGHPEHIQTFNELKPIMDSIPNIKYFTDITNEQKIELMQNAKGYIFPSLFEQPWAMVVLESLACGTPVITTNHGAFPEMVNKETGFLCNNIDEMKFAIQNINRIDPKKCRKDTEKRFDRMITAKNYIKLYEEILNGEEW